MSRAFHETFMGESRTCSTLNTSSSYDDAMAEYPRQPINASCDELAWLEGRWRGEHNGERIEEHWSAADAGTIMGMFRWIRSEQLYFYELLAIEDVAPCLTMHIKHFHPGLKGWEEKDDSVAFDLVMISPNRTAWFRRGGKTPLWLVYERAGDVLQAWFEKPDEEANPDDRFTYGRVLVGP